MANSFLKAEKIAATALGMLDRELVLSQLVWNDGAFDFTGAKNDAVTIRVPARTTAKEYAWRNDRTADIELSELTEDTVTVTLNRDFYNAVAVTDEQLTLDISDFGGQVLDPQVRAVADALDAGVATMIEGATYATTIAVTAEQTNADLWKSAILPARKALNTANVSREGRTLLVGADFEDALLGSDRLSLSVNSDDAPNALREATLGRLGGFNIVASNAIDPRSAYAFVPSAFCLVTRAPVVPSGVTFGAGASFAGYGMRWIRDYDASKLRDRSVVNTYVGYNVMLDQVTPGNTTDPQTLQRAVKITMADEPVTP